MVMVAGHESLALMTLKPKAASRLWIVAGKPLPSFLSAGGMVAG